MDDITQLISYDRLLHFGLSGSVPSKVSSVAIGQRHKFTGQLFTHFEQMMNKKMLVDFLVPARRSTLRTVPLE